MPSLNKSKQQNRPTWLANHTPLADFPSSHLTGVKKGKEERGALKDEYVICGMELHWGMNASRRRMIRTWLRKGFMWRRVRNGPDLGSGRYEWLNLKVFFFLAASPHSFRWVYECIYCSTDLDWGEYACHTSTATLHPQFCNKKSCGLSWLLRVYVGIHHLGFGEPSPVLQEPWAVEIVSWVHLYSNIELESRSWQPHIHIPRGNGAPEGNFIIGLYAESNSIILTIQI